MSQQIITYQASSENFPNPERGFYHQHAPLWIDNEQEPLDEEDLAEYRDEGITLVRAYFVIDEFRSSPLSPQALAAIEQAFTTARQTGIKLIPRFSYNFPSGSNYQSARDATLEQVMAHIAQIEPILQANADVLAFMEMGFVGAWGEWHSSSNQLINPDGTPNASSLAIIDGVLAALPVTRTAALRYPYLKQQIFGPAPLTTGQAFTSIPQARLGAHNDCFLASDTDWGTYEPSSTPGEIEAFKSYFNQDNRFLPQGGETCNDGEDAQPYISCSNALSELGRMHWSALNIGHHPDVLALWQRQGCLDEIARRLGYRLRLVQATLPLTVRPDEILPLTLKVVNDGFAAPYNPRPFVLVLRHVEAGVEYTLPLSSDPRRWESGATHTLVEKAHLPARLPAGRYDLLLHLPDPNPALATRPEYSLRLANTGIWEASTGDNRLNVQIVVAP